MNNGIYTAFSGMQAQLDALEMLANNLANLNTTAYKEDKAFFSYLREELDPVRAGENLNSTINRSVKAHGALNLSEGSLTATGRNLDIAIEGSGFLVVNTPRGIRYTRNGNLHLNAQSTLSTSDGHPVLGATGRAITLGPGTIRINENGEVSLDGSAVDRLKVVAFRDASGLEKEGGSLFVSRAQQEPGIHAAPRVRSGFLEHSNVNAMSSIVQMVNILRHFEAIQKSINLEMNEMNAKAIEKLGR